MKNVWYAVTDKLNDNVDWGTGSYDLEEAKKMLKEQGRGEIAVIDNPENPAESLCIDEIPFESLED